MLEKKWVRTALYLAAGALAAFLAVRFLLPIVLPFLIGALIAKLADPATRFLLRKSRLPRWVCAGVCVGTLYLLLAAGCWILCRMICSELVELGRQLPSIVSSLAGPMSRLHDWLSSLADRAPDGLGTALEGWVSRLFSGSAGWLDTLNDKVFSIASAFLAALPSAVLFLITSVLSSFMIASQMPAIGNWVRSILPKRHRAQITAVAGRLRLAFGGWCVAQLKLMSVTFCIVTVGLLIIGIDYALLFGLLVALIDALPVFGTGTILIPWGAADVCTRKHTLWDWPAAVRRGNAHAYRT